MPDPDGPIASPPPYPLEGETKSRDRGGVRRMASSISRLASLQSRIILLQAKLVAQRTLAAAALWGLAVALGVLAIVFLDIGVFHVLTDPELAALRPAWAYLIFAAAHLLIAGVLVLAARSILKKKLPGSAGTK